MGGKRYRTRPLGQVPFEMVTQADLDRFWARVVTDPDTGCQLWTGAKCKGYGGFSVRRMSIYAHRFAWLVHHGSQPPSTTHLDHLCRNKPCVNVAHLEPVSCWENQLRSPISISRANSEKTHCDNGHRFDVANTYIRKDTGTRQCRRCSYDRKAAKRKRQQAAGLKMTA